MLPVRLWTANPMVPTKNDQPRLLTVRPAMAVRFTVEPDTSAMMSRTMQPASTIRSGMKIAQANPITACLYLTVRSRRASWSRRSRCSQRSRPISRRSLNIPGRDATGGGVAVRSGCIRSGPGGILLADPVAALTADRVVHDDLAHETEGDGLDAKSHEEDAKQQKRPVGDAAARDPLQEHDHQHHRADPARHRSEEAKK